MAFGLVDMPDSIPASRCRPNHLSGALGAFMDTSFKQHTHTPNNNPLTDKRAKGLLALLRGTKHTYLPNGKVQN